jgi:hypothetical protein
MLWSRRCNLMLSLGDNFRFHYMCTIRVGNWFVELLVGRAMVHLMSLPHDLRMTALGIDRRHFHRHPHDRNFLEVMLVLLQYIGRSFRSRAMNSTPRRAIHIQYLLWLSFSSDWCGLSLWDSLHHLIVSLLFSCMSENIIGNVAHTFSYLALNKGLRSRILFLW